jgi:hypothetical protein
MIAKNNLVPSNNSHLLVRSQAVGNLQHRLALKVTEKMIVKNIRKDKNREIMQGP